MRYYELLYIVNPNYEDDKVKSIIDEIGEEISKYKVSIINHHAWGKKRLAYAVKNNKYGIYILLQVGAEKFDFLIDFERFLTLNKSVIRHQVIKLDVEPEKVESIEQVAKEVAVDENDVKKIEGEKLIDELEELSEVVEDGKSDEVQKTEEIDTKTESKEEGE